MNKRRILIVDDDIKLLELYEQACKRYGFTAVVAESGEKALEVIKHHKFEAMILDLNLPGISGLELCETIRKENAKIHLYAVTGYTTIFDQAKCIEAGFNEYFKKPIAFSELFERIDNTFKDDAEQRQKPA